MDKIGQWVVFVEWTDRRPEIFHSDSYITACKDALDSFRDGILHSPIEMIQRLRAGELLTVGSGVKVYMRQISTP